jgi:hypothetical protein
MDRTSLFVPGLVILLAACLVVAGCSSPGTEDAPAAPADTPRFAVGDIVRNPASSASTAWLVTGYNAAADTYERALVYPNADGSWGYRTDTRTETASRTVMETVYTEIVATRNPSSVPVVTPTEIPVVTTAGTLWATTTATPTVLQPPVITRVIPDKGDAGTTVLITDLVGDNFAAGANVTLFRTGDPAIQGTGVRVVSPRSITCSFAIPPNATAGAWDIIVTNLDGRSGTLTNIFDVHRTAESSTTSSLNTGTVPITGIDPPFAPAKGRWEFLITGSRFREGAEVTLQMDGRDDIIADPVIVNSDTQIRCFFTIPVGSMGFWDILVTNTDQSYGRWNGGLEVRS